MTPTQAQETVAKALGLYHDGQCEAEFVGQAGAYTDCGCADRVAVDIMAALLDQYGQTQWGLRWEGNDIPFEGSEAEAREHIILGGQTLLSRRVLPSIETEWEPAT